MTIHVDPDALCRTDDVGVGSSIAAHAFVGADARIGPHCVIGEHATVGSESVLGEHVTIGVGARVAPGSVLGDRVEIGPNAVVGSSEVSDRNADGPTTLERGAIVGAGAVVSIGVRIGLAAVVLPGTVVTSNVPPKAVVRGNPAQISGYVDTLVRVPSLVETSAALFELDTTSQLPLAAGGCSLWRLPLFTDLRGSLVPLEFDRSLPFAPRRLFYVLDVPGEEVRGEHAHRECEQFLVAVRGELSVVIDDGSTAVEVRLDHPDMGLYMPPRVWGIQYKFSREAVLAVLASHPYDPDDYIRDYAAFLRFVGADA